VELIERVDVTFVEPNSSLKLGYRVASKYCCFRSRARHRFHGLFRVAFPLTVSVPQSALSPEQTMPALLSGFCIRPSLPSADVANKSSTPGAERIGRLRSRFKSSDRTLLP
jgi:hypothetical protein